jgi:hypothetical protein
MWGSVSELSLRGTLVGRNVEIISVTFAVAEMPLTCLPNPFKPFVPVGVDFAWGESISIGVEDIV